MQRSVQNDGARQVTPIYHLLPWPVKSDRLLADLKADIPYERRAIELDVEGVPFPSEREARLGLDRFLCLRIVGVSGRS